MNISILYNADRISTFYTLFPIFNYHGIKIFHFFKNIDTLLKKDKNRFLIIIRFFKKRYEKISENISLLKKLRNQYDKIFFFDDSDGADSLHFELIKYFDVYYKKQLYKDKQLYCKKIYGRQLYSHYYHEKYKIFDELPKYREPLIDIGQLKKLKIAYNLGIGNFPKSIISRNVIKYIEKLFSHNIVRYIYKIFNTRLNLNNTKCNMKKEKQINARFGYKAYSNTIGFQRKHFLEKISNNKFFLTGFVPQKQYLSDLIQSFATLSPYGWGEVCFRDFESIINRSLLIKPDMDHLETWPDVYRKNKTYIPIDWDGELLSTVPNYFENRKNIYQIIDNCISVYMESYNKLDDRIDKMVCNILS